MRECYVMERILNWMTIPVIRLYLFGTVFQIILIDLPLAQYIHNTTPLFILPTITGLIPFIVYYAEKEMNRK